MQQGSFSQTSILGRTKTPTSTSLRRLGSNLSSSSTTQSQQSKSSKPSTINYPNNNPFTAAAATGVSGLRRNSNTPTATKGILKNSQYSASFLQNGNGGFDDDTRSLAGKSTTSIVTATKSQTSLGNSPSKFGAKSQRKSMSQQNNNNNSKFAPRVYLPGEEEIVVSKNVVDLSTAKSDIELLENDLGRSSLMMPKEMREKMLAMRSQMFSNNNNNANSSPSKNNSDKNDQHAETGNNSNSENPLPRGSQLLKRLQLSVDRSSNLMSELEDRSKSCESLLDQLIFAATKDERQQTKLEQKKKQAALAESLSAAGPGGVVVPSSASMGNSKIILSPSPQPKRSTPTSSSNNNNSAAKNNNKNTTYSSNLDDTFAALEYSASPPPRNAPSTSRQRQQLDNSDLVGLDDTFAGLSPI